MVCSRCPSSCSFSSHLHLTAAIAALVLFFFFFLLSPVHVSAQTNGSTTYTTDPVEVAALNTIFTKWKISSNMSKLAWNTTGDPCSGYALTIDEKTRDSDDFNPAIMCNCDNTNYCHIVRLFLLRYLSPFRKAHNLEIVGNIPDELQELKFLNNLQIAKNYLTGPLPSFIGNFSDMEYLSVGLNSLSGTLPKELGNLKKLKSLGLAAKNNFSGSIPPELGNLTSLKQMYLNSIGLSGLIPETLVKLQNLQILFASDCNFGGKVPDFIGNITTLTSLRLEGNSFAGPIPSSFINLVQLTNLRLGDISNASSSLIFTRNMTSLQILILRDCMISDVLPSDIEQFKKLKYLDLSFNNLTGHLPASLFSMQGLDILYLGNNRLSGSLPNQKSASLTIIDLSYNYLSGDFPPWVREKGLQLNLVSNNFGKKNSNSLSWGLGCLQRDVPCGRDSPNYYSFAINCGSNESLTYNGTAYEGDSMDLSTASYYVTEKQRWAVSSIGTFMDSIGPSYNLKNSSTIQNTTNDKLFQSSRLSPSSLRYYGLRLENGNYTIQLFFAELAFPNDLTWHSFGRRVFDIYVQGNLVEKDFDIRYEASGQSFRAIERAYSASVTKNFLEVHFFWAGKGTCCIPTNGVYGPLISAIKVTPNFKPSVSNEPPRFGSSSTNKALIAGVVVAATALFFIVLVVICILRRKKQDIDFGDDEDLSGLTVMPNSFSYLELKKATKNFGSANELGAGGFGAVFKGKLGDGRDVAVKQLTTASLHGKKQFVTEVATISAVRHRNLVKLYGCCYEGHKRLLVYEYLVNKSLDQALFGKSDLHLDWPTRFLICLGTARGLAYLHEESSIRIIHRDIKSSNILLDADLDPKISDFGLAKLYNERLTHISTGVAGTVGYLAPEYAMRGHLTEKADIFGFGVVTLEILSGRPCHNTNIEGQNMYLMEWAWKLHEENSDIKLMDKTLSSFNVEEALRMIGVAFLCTQDNPLLRPSMSRVVAMLIGDADLGVIPSKPTYLSDWEFDELSEMRGSTSSSFVTFGERQHSTGGR